MKIETLIEETNLQNIAEAIVFFKDNIEYLEEEQPTNVPNLTILTSKLYDLLDFVENVFYAIDGYSHCSQVNDMQGELPFEFN